MMKKLKLSQILMIALALVVITAGVLLAVFYGGEAAFSPQTKKNEPVAIEVPAPNEAAATKITLKQDASEVSGKGAVVEQNKVRINQSGTYVLSGKLTDGKIEIEADDKATVILLLNGAEITNKNGKAIESLRAAHTSVQMKEGTKNVVQSGEETDAEQKETDTSESSVSGSAIYAVEEMSIAGKGELTVKGYRNDGIKGKASLCIADGNLNIQSSHDAVQAEENLQLSGGKVTVKTGGGSGAEDTDSLISGDRPDFGKDAVQDVENQAKESFKGFKCGSAMVISGGEYEVDSYDDGFHSNGTVAVSGGDLTVNSGDKGIHADQSLDVSGGKITIAKSGEGLEANQIAISDGEVNITSSDDGMNACGGSFKMERGPNQALQKPDEKETGQEEPEDMPNLTISGGTVMMNASGDGLDSNGNLTISGGTIVVDGPTNDGNGAIDSGSENGGKCTISGGTVLAVGSSGMAEVFEESSSQCSFLHNLSSSYQEGDEIVISDAGGKELFRHTAVKQGTSIVFSSPDLKKGETYTVEAGEQKETVTQESNSQSNGKSRGDGGGFGKRQPGQKGDMDRKERKM